MVTSIKQGHLSVYPWKHIFPFCLTVNPNHYWKSEGNWDDESRNRFATGQGENSSWSGKSKRILICHEKLTLWRKVGKFKQESTRLILTIEGWEKHLESLRLALSLPSIFSNSKGRCDLNHILTQQRGRICWKFTSLDERVERKTVKCG